MDTAFHYEGIFDKDVLMEYSKGMGNRQVSATVAQYHSDDDIRILNMISWKNINNLLFFGGGIVKKTFYPDPFSSAVPMYKPGETTPVYVVTRGYFSSIRPGVGPVGAQRSGAKAPEDDRLFLNVKPTTLTFFPSVKLQDWLKVRGSLGSDGDPEFETQEEIIGHRVTFNGDPLDSKVERKQRVIMGFEGKVGAKNFTKKGTNTSVSMLKNLKDSKYHLVPI